MKSVLLLSLLLFSSCNPLFQHVFYPGDPKLTEDIRYRILNGLEVENVDYGPTLRLNLMTPPVKVVAIGETSHGVFRDKYHTYDIVVEDGSGSRFTFYGTTWASVKIGDVIKEK